MSNDLNKWMGIIRLTRDPELKYTQSGKAICSFSGASSQSYQKDGEKKETVSYFDFQVWGKLGEIVSEHAKKGMRLAVDGRLQQQRWDDQDGKKRARIEIVVNEFQFLDGKKESSNKPESKPADNKDHGPDSYEDNPFSDDEPAF
jgi:single-strand DNA-binding protein